MRLSTKRFSMDDINIWWLFMYRLQPKPCLGSLKPYLEDPRRVLYQSVRSRLEIALFLISIRDSIRIVMFLPVLWSQTFMVSREVWDFPLLLSSSWNFSSESSIHSKNCVNFYLVSSSKTAPHFCCLMLQILLLSGTSVFSRTSAAEAEYLRLSSIWIETYYPIVLEAGKSKFKGPVWSKSFLFTSSGAWM